MHMCAAGRCPCRIPALHTCAAPVRCRPWPSMCVSKSIQFIHSDIDRHIIPGFKHTQARPLFQNSAYIIILAGQEELGPSAVGQAACLLLFLHRLSALHHDEVPAPLRLDWLTPVGRIARTYRTRCQHESACAAQGDTVTAREVARTANRPPCIRAPPSRSPDRARLDSSTRGAHAHQPCPPSGERPPR